MRFDYMYILILLTVFYICNFFAQFERERERESEREREREPYLSFLPFRFCIYFLRSSKFSRQSNMAIFCPGFVYISKLIFSVHLKTCIHLKYQ